MKTTLLLCTLSLSIEAAQAQTKLNLGPVVGLNIAGTTNNSPSNTTINYRRGFEAGLQGIIQLGHLAVQPSLRFSQKGLYERYGVDHFSRYTYYRLNYLTLPVNLAYSLRQDGQGLQVFAGPYAGLLLGGNYQLTADEPGPFGGISYSDGKVAPGEDFSIPAAGSTTRIPRRCRRLDVGVQAGLGYRLGNLLVQADFAFGLDDLYPLYAHTYNRTAQASMSYLFSPKH
jgi:hypothetical protein